MENYFISKTTFTSFTYERYEEQLENQCPLNVSYYLTCQVGYVLGWVPTLSQVWPAFFSLRKKCQPVVRNEKDIEKNANSNSSMKDFKKCVLKALVERVPLY